MQLVELKIALKIARRDSFILGGS